MHTYKQITLTLTLRLTHGRQRNDGLMLVFVYFLLYICRVRKARVCFQNVMQASLS